MKRNDRRAAWVGAGLGITLAVLLNIGLAHASSDEAFVTEEFHHTYPLTANGRVDLENINGAVHILAWDRNEVKVDAVKRARDQQRLKDAEIRIDPRADAISISTHYRDQERDWHSENWDDRHNPASVDYTLTVPRNSRLDEIKLINGALDITGVSGEVSASCINGKLTAHGLASRVKLATINGPLEADFERLQTTFIELASVNGPVRLTLPSDVKANVEAATVHGRIDNDFGLHANDHRFIGHGLHGELGGGGVQIRLRNVNGTIEVHHANDGHALSPAKDTGNRGDDDEI